MTNQPLTNHYLIVDWGTTNFRVFLMNNKGELVDKKELPMGLLHITDGDFAQALASVLADWLTDYKTLPILMAGMVGSASGWFNVDYVETNVNTELLLANAFNFQLPWGANATIIPGVKHKAKNNGFDVMRGEEVQIFGLGQLINEQLFNAVLPGTHSKHVRVVNGEIWDVCSYMTGELFSVISEHTILGKGLPKQSNSKDAFILGVRESGTENLTSSLFTARTHRLFNNIAEDEVFNYLSGLLIGNELKSLTGNHVYLVGGEKLCDKYQIACESLGINATYKNGDDCFLAGMKLLKEHLFSGPVSNHLSA